MIVLVTPVGTSLFTNYLEKKPSDATFRDNYNTIKKDSVKTWDTYDIEIEALRSAALCFISTYKVEASAELQSIAKIQKELENDNIAVRLLASDTITSRLAAEILVNCIEDGILETAIQVEFDEANDVIRGLQVKSTKEFSDNGMPNLIRRISQFDDEQLVINITGGYKAAVPYLTILSQIDQIPLFYTFEELDGESPDLIKIPQLPLTVDWQLIQYYADVFSQIENLTEDWVRFEEEHEVAINDLRGCIEVSDGTAGFSWFGERFWQRYQNNYSVVINPDSYFKYIKAWHGVNTAIEGLYTNLTTVLSNNSAFSEPECFNAIKELGQQNNLNHGGPINNHTFIFKTQKKRLPIRFAYTFTVGSKSKTVESITIYEILRGKFNHKIYVAEFKKKYKNQRSMDEFVTLTLPKPIKST